jgi:HK97 family phage major capsid protein
MDRDDVVDITDFDVIAWIKAEMRMMLDEEIARAILIGDGRQSDDESHIPEDHVRPIANDVPLFNTKVTVDVESNADSKTIASETIDAIIRARKHYKGSGNPTFFTTEDVLTEMLLLKDGIGHTLYKTETELATALRVKEIVTVEPMEGQTIKNGETYMPLIGIIVNLADYNVGADKGGEVNMFDDFDLDFNKYEYLIETRISGALVKPFSALTILENKGVLAG